MEKTPLIEALNIARFLQLIDEVLHQGYGEVTFRVVIRDGKVTVLQFTKTESATT